MVLLSDFTISISIDSIQQEWFVAILDLIRDLRKGEATPDKATKYLRNFGVLSILGGVWNIIVPMIPTINESGFPFPLYFAETAFVSLILIGGISLLGMYGIQRNKKWGIHLGQLAVTIFIVMILALGWVMHRFVTGFGSEGVFEYFSYIIAVVVFVQFGVPALYFIKYLARVPIEEDYQNSRFGI